MRKYTKNGQLETVICNCCGKKLIVDKGILREGCISVNHQWDYFSEKDGEIHRFDLCERRFTALTCAKAAMTRCGPSSPSMWKWRSRWSCCREDFGLKKGFIPGCGERLGDESFFHYLSYARLLGKEGGKTLWIAGTKEGTRLVNELAS